MKKLFYFEKRYSEYWTGPCFNSHERQEIKIIRGLDQAFNEAWLEFFQRTHKANPTMEATIEFFQQHGFKLITEAEAEALKNLDD